MRKHYFAEYEELCELPVDVQLDIADHLVDYSEVSVTRENGKYSCFNGSCLSVDYAPDHKVWFFDKETVKRNPYLKAYIEREYQKEKEWEFEHRHEINWESLND